MTTKKHVLTILRLMEMFSVSNLDVCAYVPVRICVSSICMFIYAHDLKNMPAACSAWDPSQTHCFGFVLIFFGRGPACCAGAQLSQP